jgi:hypothetical protein
MAGKSGVAELRAYFAALNTPQKKEFIQKLKQKLVHSKNSQYKNFLAECVKIYNQEIKNPGENPGARTISAESVAVAFAAMLAAAKPDGYAPPAPRLAGTWQRSHKGKTLYITFNADGSLQTNTVKGHDELRGLYKIDADGNIQLEPHGLLQINGLMVSASGKSLTVSLGDGSMHDYTRADANSV